MLVLSRHLSESIVITAPDGTRITVSVEGLRGDKVRLGIEAPRQWSVHRHQVQDRIDAGERRPT